MTYRKKFIVLSGIAAALALLYVVTVIFDPERVGSRTDAYSWIEPSQVPLISSITIKSANPEEEALVLSRNGGKWFVTHNGRDYPARQVRVEDFIAAFSKKAPYPVRSTSASSHEKFSLSEYNSARLIFSGGAGVPVLNLLLGESDVTGQNVYMRKQGENEVRSGEDRFSMYMGMSASTWYNLRLFPESEDGKLDVGNVQRITVYPPSEEGENSVPLMITRRGKEWNFNFELAEPDMERVDSYVRDILNTSGSTFAEDVVSSGSIFNYSRIELQIGDGTIRSIRFGPPNENDQYYAAISGSDLVYTIPSWTMNRLFPDFQSFSKN